MFEQFDISLGVHVFSVCFPNNAVELQHYKSSMVFLIQDS